MLKVSSSQKIVCIYKITSPSGRVYIGQTINFYRRLNDYKNKLAYKQPFLKSSFAKYGLGKHAFEIVHELPADVSQEVLNEYERLYMALYTDCGISLLNVKEGGSNGRNTDDSIKKANEKWKAWAKSNPEKHAISWQCSVALRKGRPLNADHRQKLSLSGKGRVFSEEHRKKISEAQKGKPKNFSEERINKAKAVILNYSGKNAKPVNQYSMAGELVKAWNSATAAEELTGISRKAIEKCVKKQRGGKTAGGYIWKYAEEIEPVNPEHYMHNHSPKPKPVLQCNIDGTVVKEWPSAMEAARHTGIRNTSISSCVRKYRGKSQAGGYVWRYAS